MKMRPVTRWTCSASNPASRQVERPIITSLQSSHPIWSEWLSVLVSAGQDCAMHICCYEGKIWKPENILPRSDRRILRSSKKPCSRWWTWTTGMHFWTALERQDTSAKHRLHHPMRWFLAMYFTWLQNMTINWMRSGSKRRLPNGFLWVLLPTFTPDRPKAK